jgi:hypothetical protein
MNNFMTKFENLKEVLGFWFFGFFYLFICAYNVWAISPRYSLPPPSPPQTSLSPTTPLASRQNLFCPYL